METTFLLVDFENVKDLSLAALPSAYRIKIFVGKSQTTIPVSLAMDAPRFGEGLEWVKISGDGKNNLDFHLAYYLGRLAHEFPKANFVILSKDKGFDSLIAHLIQQRVACRRIDSLSELSVQKPTPEDPYFNRALEILSKTEVKKRPKNRKTFTHHISTLFQKKLAEEEIRRVVDMFFTRGLVTEVGNAIAYAL